MSVRMSPPPGTSNPDPDVDRTAELPTLESAAHAAGSDRRPGSTDTWVAPGRDEALVAAERRAAQVERELAQLRAEHAFQLDEHARARAHFEEQLAEARGLLSAAGARAEDLQRRVQELETAARRDEQRRPDRESALRDSREERERTLGLIEALHSAESRRAILEELVTDLQREGEERERELARVARALVGRDAHTRELEAELAERAARIARLEQQVGSLTGSMSERDAQLRRAREETRALQDGPASPRGESGSLNERMKALQALAAEQGSSATRSAAAHEAQLAELRARNAELDSQLAAERARLKQLEEERAGVLKTAPHDRDRGSSAASPAAADARLKELQERVAEQEEAMRALQKESSASVTRARELEADLHAAEEAVHRLESEARSRNARLEELERANVRWRSLEEARHAAAEAAAGYAPQEPVAPPESAGARSELPAARSDPPAVRPNPPAVRPDPPAARPEPSGTRSEPATARADSPGERADRQSARSGGGEAVPSAEVAPDGAARLLIRSEDGREIVHVLGRRTSIGRTSDNDLQIDAQFISRHHAVILVGPVHTIIEDLNSTNGVQVNGRRVTRQILKDGDTVHIARLQYRFAIRKGSSEKR